MPPKVVLSKKTPTNSAAVGVIKAKCSDNQAILDQLFSIKLRIMKHTPNSNYYFTIVRAIESTKQHAVPIQSYQDFITLKYVGPTIAQQVTFPTATTTTTSTANADGANGNGTTQTSSSNGNSKNPVVPKKKRSQPQPQPQIQRPNENAPSAAAASTVSIPPHVPRNDEIPTPPIISSHPPPPKKRSRVTTTRTTASDKGKKQAAYEQAVHASKTWKKQVQKQYERNRQALTAVQVYQQIQQPEFAPVAHCQWRVVLLIDIREQWCDYIQAKCTMSGIPCEARQLPIGDMMWIVQGCIPNAKYSNNNNNNDGPTSEPKQLVVVEFVAGTILERKTPEDLKSSIFGTRYMEQRLRLQHCGIPQIIFLLEGDIHRELYACPVSTIQTAIWETRLFMNFNVVHTNHADDTVVTLKRYHRRILQRTFPRAFSSRSTTGATEALPTFHEAHRNSRRRSSNADNHNNDNSDSQSHQANRRRLRQRRQSLAELTFDMEPTIPFDMERFISYQELCCKVQYDRESGRQSVHHLYTAMLKQVSTIYNSTKCSAITNQYPTIDALCAAFYESIRTNHQNRITPVVDQGKYPTAQYMVTNVPLGDPNANNNQCNNDDSTTKSTTNTRRVVGPKSKTLGHRSSNELFVAFTGGDTYLTEYIQSHPSQLDRNIGPWTDRDATRNPPLPPSGTTAAAATTARHPSNVDRNNGTTLKPPPPPRTAAAAVATTTTLTPMINAQATKLSRRLSSSSSSSSPEKNVSSHNNEVISLQDDEDDEVDGRTNPDWYHHHSHHLGDENYHPNCKETIHQNASAKDTQPCRGDLLTTRDEDVVISSRTNGIATTKRPSPGHSTGHIVHLYDNNDTDSDDDSVLHLFGKEVTSMTNTFSQKRRNCGPKNDDDVIILLDD